MGNRGFQLGMALAALLLVACSNLPEPREDAGSPEGEGESEGEGEGESGGESCADALPVTFSVAVTGTTEGAAQDVPPSCMSALEPASGDVVYAFSLAEPAAIAVEVESGTELAVALVRMPCGDGDELACADAAIFGEILEVPFVPAGDWRVVIVANGDGHGGASRGPFVLRIMASSPTCVGDERDSSDDAPAGATDLGAHLSEAAPQRLCPGDDDWFLVEHLGGALSADTGAATVRALPAALAGDGTPMVAGAELNLGADVPAGLSRLETTAPGATLANPCEYALSLTRGCIGDTVDHVAPRADDAAAPPLIVDATVLTGRRLACGDVDGLRVGARVPAEATVRLSGAAGLTVSAVGTLISDEGADRVLVFNVDPAVAEGLVLGPAAASLSYGIEVSYRYPAPANDTCPAASSMAVPSSAEGTTLGAANDRLGSCNGDGAIPDPSLRGGEVFYALSVAAPTSLELVLEQRDPGFSGTVELVGPLGTATCADLAAVPVVGCAADCLRANVPAGEYLLVVESRAGRLFHGKWLLPQAGNFELTVTGYPGGFPPPEACGLAIEAAPPSTSPTSVEVDATAFSRFNDAWGSCGGPTPEAVVTFVAAASGNVVARTLPYSFDTLLHVREADCAGGPEVACNDDAVPRLEAESHIEFPVAAGARYFVFVDGFGYLPPDTCATLILEAAP